MLGKIVRLRLVFWIGILSGILVWGMWWCNHSSPVVPQNTVKPDTSLITVPPISALPEDGL